MTMTFETQIAHSVEEIGQIAWDKLAGQRPFASYRWYAFGEKVLASRRPIYIILFQAGQPIARATFWLSDDEPLEVSPAAARHLLSHFIGRYPLLLCRSPLSSTSGLILPESALSQAALEQIVAAAQQQARAHRASFVLFDYLTGRDVKGLQWPPDFNHVQVNEPGTSLITNWPDFDSYYRQGLTRSARRSYRTNLKRAESQGSIIRKYPMVTDVDRAMRLISNVYRRYGTPIEPWMERILIYAHLVNATWITAEVDGEIIGCELMLADGNTCFLTALGLDYSFRYIYFQMFYEDIRHAINRGVHELRGGSTAYEVKQRMGFQNMDNDHLVFAATNTWLNRLFGRLAPWFSQRNSERQKVS